MTQKGFCEKHGAYKSQDGTCPYCRREAQQRLRSPQVPPALVTQVSGRPPLPSASEVEPTELLDRSPERPLAAPVGPPTRVSGGAGELTRLSPEPAPSAEAMDGARPAGRTADPEATQVLGGPRLLLGWLIVKEGPRRGQIMPIKDGSLVGRKGADVVMPDPTVSELHARFRVEGDQFVVWDLGSANGTFVNGERIRQATWLKENDEIRIGETVLVLKVLA